MSSLILFLHQNIAAWHLPISHSQHKHSCTAAINTIHVHHSIIATIECPTPHLAAVKAGVT